MCQNYKAGWHLAVDEVIAIISRLTFLIHSAISSSRKKKLKYSCRLVSLGQRNEVSSGAKPSRSAAPENTQKCSNEKLMNNK